MEYEVIVVGGGIGGLTVAALLAARGVNVCLLERQSQVGGCVATVEHAGHRFDPTFGLYTGWEADGICYRLCAELGVTAPRTHAASSAYAVRLPDGTTIPRPNTVEEFDDVLRSAFPECAEAALRFYHDLTAPAVADQSPLTAHLDRCSSRFRTFIDIQLQMLAQRSSAECGYQLAANVLDPRRSFWRIDGGIQALVDLLAASFRHSGGKLRLNSPVLRLAYAADGSPMGLDLLNGERIVAARAVVSNLTIWDTYGKLIGPARTPRQVSATLKELRAWGVYQMFLALKPPVSSTVSPLLIATELALDDLANPAHDQLTFCANTSAATAVVSTYTPAEDWFSFHEDHEAFEARDRALLEDVWTRLHSAMPELGDGIELIETATPQSFYEDLRRRFGMIGRPQPHSPNQITGSTLYPNLWMVGDTVAGGVGIEGVVESARQIAATILARIA